MAAAPHRDHSAEGPFLDALADAFVPTSPRRVSVRPSGLPGLLGALASLLTSSPPSTGPCFDKSKGTHR